MHKIEINVPGYLYTIVGKHYKLHHEKIYIFNSNSAVSWM